ncbi:hypothetical protein Leryth_001331 [Lithospermum erythrorhizon]|nr:hypothetical protein Leryth_001331 [Lithospermum erythrorhizon]
MQRVELVFVPAPGIGHLVSMAEFAKRLLERDARLSMTILVMVTEFTSNVSAYARSLQGSKNNRVRYIYLPQTDFPFEEEQKKSVENAVSRLMESYKPHVKDAITKVLSDSETKLAGLVGDFFCTCMIDVAKEFNVPPYLFFTSGAASLGFMMLYMPIYHNKFKKVFEFSDDPYDVPTFANHVPSNVLPSAVYDKEGGGYDCFLKHGILFNETKGIIINTFSELETHAIDVLASDKNIPPIYPVGPILDLKNAKKGSMEECENIMKWLDDQPPSSVLFLCFGSLGGFEPPQIVQIAIALKRSGLRFLWSIRPPKAKKIPRNGSTDCSNNNLDNGALFPKGFLKETKDIGMICGWAPQVDVLAHKAIGGFVSHCGWNSILESIWFGVPIAAWPIYAEQQLNAFQIVKELGLAEEIKMDYRIINDVIVGADEIEKAITSLMEKDNPIRKRFAEMKEKSRSAVCDGGSSFASVGCFIEKIMEE